MRVEYWQEYSILGQQKTKQTCINMQEMITVQCIVLSLARPTGTDINWDNCLKEIP
jgi:hypothetical protein